MDLLDSLNQSVLQSIQDPGISHSIRRMVEIHVAGPWVEGLKSIIITPLKEGLEEYLERDVFEWEGRIWFYPSLHWWQAHAKTSHAPVGMGCSAEKHVEFLTQDSEDPEFLYGHVLSDGNAYILGPEDFSLECDWWQTNISSASPGY